ncbi:MAG: NADH dehydrogenase [Microgenomates group bacterium GW2011_GWA1_Microgenomates_45_10]|nr:MAG: NADH dehydrogenase [Microgenomates group bacterium GW2011_GWA1_Microgenomates_45_10]
MGSMFELIIIGGGPAGVAAAIYAARKKIKTAIITEEFGGQSTISDDIQNWIGQTNLSGFDLAKQLEAHLRVYQNDIEIVGGQRVEKVEKLGDRFRLAIADGITYEAKKVLVTSGSHRKRLEVPGGKEFDGKGVAYCATCDAPLYQDKDVAVVGGGNAGLESVIDLEPYASKIYLLHRRDELKGDPVSQEKIKGMKKVEIIYNADTQEIMGDKFVTGLRYRDNKTGEEKTLAVQGVFVEIGIVPNSDIVADLVKLNSRGEIVVDHKTQLTSDPGIWAAGDVTDVLYNQNNISAGDAIKAVLNIYDRITGQNREVK